MIITVAFLMILKNYNQKQGSQGFFVINVEDKKILIFLKKSVDKLIYL